MNQFVNQLEKYADLVVRVGLNLQNGQKLLIRGDISASAFIRLVTKKAYEAGALEVLVDYRDEEIQKLTVTHAPEEGLTGVPTYIANGYVDLAEENIAFLNLQTPNPSFYKDVDPSRMASINKSSSSRMNPFFQYITNGSISWVIVTYATKEWAANVFPDLSEEEALTKLWELIFYTTRVDQEDPVSLWKKHIKEMTLNANKLNNKQFKKLHYQGPGTDLTIEITNNAKWICAEFTNDQGIAFVPNLPTEEVFTIPNKYGVNGTVSSTKPLVYSGNIIDQFTLTFKDGKVIDFSAEKGYETLKNLLDTDEGAKYLGEIAIVPHDSPISNTGVVFNNTLFDENASCHLALGNALGICVENSKEMNDEELNQIGFNKSITHVDFMIGSGELNIDGVLDDGTTQPIFRNGNWAIN
ncbi:peptidase M29 [Bacillus coahuilensis m2-6]|uniref:aminopeptidase n=1 Tax=Bacillus coahuilensis TaxID=408580 RepID=UPI0001850CF2|nr:aminopeptidase [Bacillus coahuilensis]KUP08298.1 peptidase M29 [Bacillus coahuilensis m2-6]